MPRFLSALDRKLLRDLWHIRTQVIAISLVMISGVATFVMSLTTLRSLTAMQAAYYERYRFADVFAPLVRAPDLVADRVAGLDGVQSVETRTVADVTLDVPGLAEPGVGRLISLPDQRQPHLNALHLIRGRWLEPTARDEALAHASFVESHGFNPGDQLDVVIEGRLRTLTIVGVVLSPEYVLQVAPGELLPDYERFGIFWMREAELDGALDMDGAFNNLVASLAPNAHQPAVIDAIDRILARYGGLGAYGREDHLPHRYLEDDIQGLRAIGLFAPSIFLGVAAFLLNVVMSRLVRTQREQIAALRAYGYSRAAVAGHYLKMVMVIVVIGVSLGTALGRWMAAGLTGIYVQFYRFPTVELALSPDVIFLAIAVAGGAAIAGTLVAVAMAMSLPPAEAMRPEPPATFRPTIVERLGLQRFIPPIARMILRQLERHPVRAGLSALGIATAVAVVVLGRFTTDAVEYLMQFEFEIAQRHDVSVGFVEPVQGRVIHDLAALPGVLAVETQRAAPARIRHRHRSRLTSIQAMDHHPQLMRVLDEQEQPLQLPEQGLVLSHALARRLDVRPGQTVTVEIQERHRPVLELEVAGLIHQYTGLTAFMSRRALNDAMREDRLVTGGAMRVDMARLDELYHQLKRTPGVASVTVRRATLQNFDDTIAETQRQFRSFNLAFAVVIAFGVVYNTARVSLSERSRELATLRVLGFTRAEISRILLGELAVLTLLALPLGMVLGYGFAAFAAWGFETDMFRIPLVISRRTYGFAAVTVLLAAAASGLVVRRRLDRLDLIGVLKARE